MKRVILVLILLTPGMARAQGEEDCVIKKDQPSPCTKNKKLEHDIHCLPRDWVDKMESKDDALARTTNAWAKCEVQLQECQKNAENPSRLFWFTSGAVVGIALSATLFLVAK